MYDFLKCVDFYHEERFSFVLFSSFAHVLFNRYSADAFKKSKPKILDNEITKE